MNELFDNFCKNSSMHGLHYLVNKKKTLPERFFWTVLLTTAIFVLVSEVLLELKMLSSSTVLAVVENPHYDLSAVEFPAITVCPNINVMNSKVDSLLRSYNVSEKNISSFKNSLIALSLMRFAYYNLPQDYVNSINGNVYSIKNDDIQPTMIEVKPDLDTIMDSCTLKSKRVDCKKLFRPQFTLEGFCYSFNSKTAVRSTQDPVELPPFELSNKTIVGYRTSMFGIAYGLGFRLKSLAHESLSKTVFGDYYTIIVHNPSLIPDMNKVFTILSDDPFNKNYIGISVSVVEADSSLSYMEEPLRDCQFVNDSKVSSCLLECKISSILSYCNCLPYYLHHLIQESEVCGLGHLKCLSDLAGFFRRYGVPKGILGFPDWILSWDTRCPCLQTCSYTAYTSQLKTDHKQINNIDGGWTTVDIFYNSFAVKYSRTASYLFRQFIVSFGSFANLLLGFSAVAFVDFLMYSLKLFKVVFNKISKNKSDTIIIRKTKMKSKVFISR